MVENEKKNTDKIAIKSITIPEVSEVSERSEARERSEQSGASVRVSGASERANGRASGPVLTSRFMAVLNHSGVVVGKVKNAKKCTV